MLPTRLVASLHQMEQFPHCNSRTFRNQDICVTSRRRRMFQDGFAANRFQLSNVFGWESMSSEGPLIKCYHPRENPPRCALCPEPEDLYYETLVRHLPSLKISPQALQRGDSNRCKGRLCIWPFPRWLRRNPHADPLTVDPPEPCPPSPSDPNRRAFIVHAKKLYDLARFEYCSPVAKSNSHRHFVKFPSNQH
ncbi:hypothetical protein Aperf_G00000071801 [Anoplocephala perfoliata]